MEISKEGMCGGVAFRMLEALGFENVRVRNYDSGYCKGTLGVDPVVNTGRCFVACHGKDEHAAIEVAGFAGGDDRDFAECVAAVCIALMRGEGRVIDRKAPYNGSYYVAYDTRTDKG